MNIKVFMERLRKLNRTFGASTMEDVVKKGLWDKFIGKGV